MTKKDRIARSWFFFFFAKKEEFVKIGKIEEIVKFTWKVHKFIGNNGVIYSKNREMSGFGLFYFLGSANYQQSDGDLGPEFKRIRWK